jgi:hypothetical protein
MVENEDTRADKIETDSNTESDEEQETSQSQTQEKRSQYLNTKLQPQRKCYKTTVSKLYNLYRFFFYSFRTQFSKRYPVDQRDKTMNFKENELHAFIGVNFLWATKNYSVTKITGQALKT